MLLASAPTDPAAELSPGAGVEALWARFRGGRDPSARDALVHSYQRYARMMAAKAYARRISGEIEFDDYLQYAQVGLLEAIDRFDPARGIKFETFAGQRVTGAILNGLAGASELREQIAARKRLVAQRVALLQEGHEAAGSGDDVFARLADAAIGLALGFMLEGSGMYRQDEEQAAADTTYAGVELRQLRAQLRSAIAQLPERQRQVLQAHYLQNEPFEQVAERMKLSRGRVSQLHGEGLRKLRASLGGGAGVDFSC
jgi:RNA polymerase sigma factor for flagellar operon FliA